MTSLLLLLFALAPGAWPTTPESCQAQGFGVLCQIGFDDAQHRPAADAVLGFSLTDFVPPNSVLCALNASQIAALQLVDAVRSIKVIPYAPIRGEIPVGQQVVKIGVVLGQNPARNQTRFIERVIGDLSGLNGAVEAIGDSRLIVQVANESVVYAVEILAEQCEVSYVEIAQTANIIN